MIIIVHPSADLDLDLLYESDDDSLVDAAATIEVLLDELSSDNHFLGRMHNCHETWLGEPSADTDRVVSLWRKGYNILRLKVWDCGELLPYRVIYAFHPALDEFHILGVLHREICYDHNNPKVQRVLNDYHALGIPTY